ncbi:uncharacterized protein LOC132392330 isoform X2 [Hypanus sabinus]|uniref:uncharacterized protein LOC132392330 isoform X2 n=1 Tax=Hypanus sabinus TaxID=79690 RepID=UPI0028C3CD62|nr:uncharacterized protein LOC132392330 isoform X2 [Hypanus sabinus]
MWASPAKPALLPTLIALEKVVMSCLELPQSLRCRSTHSASNGNTVDLYGTINKQTKAKSRSFQEDSSMLTFYYHQLQSYIRPSHGELSRACYHSSSLGSELTNEDMVTSSKVTFVRYCQIC